MTFRTTFAATSLVALLLGACSSTINATNPNGVSAADVDRCKSSCDKMKFFDCASADEQAKCYNDCDAATLNQIQIFTGCAENSICDPACRTTIQPKPASGTTPMGGGGASASSCGTACDKLVSCSLIKVGDKDACVTSCQKDAYQYQIDCVNNQACDKVQTVCGGSSAGGGSGGGTLDAGSADSFKIMECQSACDSANFFSCIDATQLSSCRALCTTAPAAARDSYTSCQNGAGGMCTKATDCYTVFSQ